ncbi:MAG: hypothetical protein V1888_03190 [archaeon]
MRLLLHQNKKGLSNLVAYVLLITITISLSIVVYGWLKFYVEAGDVESCPEGVNLIVSSYECVSGVGGFLNLSLKNKGLFSVDGYILRVHNRTDAEFGFYVLDSSGSVIKPGEILSESYVFAETVPGINKVTFVEVQPYMEDMGNINCESYAAQRIDC